MKQIIGTIILLVAMQQVFGQECVQCVGVSITGTSASAIGTNTVASGNSAFASGFASEATYNYATAIGFYSFATQTKAVSIGSMVKATFDRAMVIGSGGEYGSDNYLVNSRPRSLMIGFNSINPTLYVSESPTNVNFDNTGSVGIGNVTAPQAKLHIRADAGEPATLRLEATGTSGDNVFSRMLFTPNHIIQAANNQNLTFSTQSTKHFVFQNGNVGVGTQQPEEKLQIAQGNVYIEDIEYGIIMKSPDGNCWKGTLTNNGLLSFEPLEKCPGETIIATRSNLPNPAIIMKPNPARSQVTINCEGVHRPDLHYQLLDTSGKIIQSGRLENNAAILSLVTLPNGVYLVQVMDRTQLIATEKLVVE